MIKDSTVEGFKSGVHLIQEKHRRGCERGVYISTNTLKRNNRDPRECWQGINEACVCLFVFIEESVGRVLKAECL